MAQDVIDRLEERLHTLTDNSREKVDCLNDLAWEIGFGDLPKGQALRKEAMTIAQALHYDRGVAYAQRNEAYQLFLSGHLDKSLELVEIPLEYFTKKDDRAGQASTNDIKAFAYSRLGSYGQAMELYLKSLEFYKVAGDKRGQAWAHNNLALIFKETGNSRSRLEHLQEGRGLFEEIEYFPGLARSLTGLATYYYEQQDFAKALEFEEQALKIYSRLAHSPLAMAFGYGDTGLNFYRLGKLEQAAHALQTAYAAAADLGNPEFLAGTAGRLGRVYIAQNQPDKARAILARALGHGRRTAAKPTRIEVLEVLAEYYEFIGNYKKALHYTRCTEETRQQVFNEDSKQKIENLQVAIKVANVEAEAKVEKARREATESILYDILPNAIVDEILENGAAKPVHYDEATVLFTDFVGFSSKAAGLSPQELLEKLDYSFSNIDAIVREHGLEKLKTIGDAYMAVSGVPDPNMDGAYQAVKAGLEICSFFEKADDLWPIRIGIHTGPVVAGVIGRNKPAYDIWGDTVNIASRMESASQANRVNISISTYERLGGRFACEARGRIEAKNIGLLEMFFVS